MEKLVSCRRSTCFSGSFLDELEGLETGTFGTLLGTDNGCGGVGGGGGTPFAVEEVTTTGFDA